MNMNATKRHFFTLAYMVALVIAGRATSVAWAATGDQKTAQAARFVSVKDHGATGDGVTDDGRAVKTAFDAAPDGTGVYFPSGTYFFANGIVIKDRARLTVTGDPGALLKAAGGKSKLILSFEKCDDITVTGLRFDLNGSSVWVHENGSYDGNLRFIVKMKSIVAKMPKE